MADIDVIQHGNVATVVLDRNALNTLSPKLVDDLAPTLGDLARDPGVDAFVLASNAPKFFSAGWDLPALQDLKSPEMDAFISAFDKLIVELACLPVATVAALEGFAVAGGFILALACDWRVMSCDPKRKVGLTEVDLGVPIPLPAQLLLEDLVGGRVTRDVALAGRLLGPEEAMASGCVDRLAPTEEVRDVALEIARELAAKPSHSVGHVKTQLRQSFLDRVAAGGRRRQEVFLDAWFHSDTRPLLSDAASKLIPRE